MFLSKLSFFKFVPTVLAALAAVSNAAPALVPVAPVGNVAGVQSVAANGDTRLFYQDSTNAIHLICVTGPFTGSTSVEDCNGVFIPASVVLPGTPIAVTSIDGSTTWSEIHIFFISPSHVLSEYYWTATGGTIGGANCTLCVTQSGFGVVPGSQVLYAMESPVDNTIRVGFVSAGSPGTLSEAVRSPAGKWSLATLPNA